MRDQYQFLIYILIFFIIGACGGLQSIDNQMAESDSVRQPDPSTLATSLQIEPQTASITTGGNIEFTSIGGTPPFSFSITSGTGSVSLNGEFQALTTPGTTVINITDSLGNTSEATVVIEASPDGNGAIEKAFLSEQCRSINQNQLVCPDIVYDQLDLLNPKDDLKLDFYVQRDPIGKNLPLIIFIHGGGWRNGDRKGSCFAAVRSFASRGYAVACISYRLTQVGNSIEGEEIPSAIFPAQIQDVRTAIRYLRENSGSVVNPNRFGAWGSSAGGHLTALLATSGNDPTLDGRGNLKIPSHVQAAIDYCGPTDLLEFVDGNGRSSIAQPENLVGGPRQIPSVLVSPLSAIQAQAVENANPIKWIDGDDPPILIAHGASDGTVPVSSSQIFNTALIDAGVDVTYIELPDVKHGFNKINQTLNELQPDVIENFLDTHLKN